MQLGHALVEKLLQRANVVGGQALTLHEMGHQAERRAAEQFVNESRDETALHTILGDQREEAMPPAFFVVRYHTFRFEISEHGEHCILRELSREAVAHFRHRAGAVLPEHAQDIKLTFARDTSMAAPNL